MQEMFTCILVWTTWHMVGGQHYFLHHPRNDYGPSRWSPWVLKLWLQCYAWLYRVLASGWSPISCEGFRTQFKHPMFTFWFTVVFRSFFFGHSYGLTIDLATFHVIFFILTMPDMYCDICIYVYNYIYIYIFSHLLWQAYRIPQTG